MKRRLFPILSVALILAVFSLRQDFTTPAEAVSGSAGTTRRPAPVFALPDLSGHKVDLLTYRGYVVVLNFWATWCAPCRAEIPELINLQNKYRVQGLRIIGVSLDDDAGPILDFSRKFNVNYPIVIGNAGLAERYGGILGLPVSFLVGCDGRIYARYDGRIDILRVERELKPLLEAQPCVRK